MLDGVSSFGPTSFALLTLGSHFHNWHTWGSGACALYVLDLLSDVSDHLRFHSQLG